jgi:hypothetical protein
MRDFMKGIRDEFRSRPTPERVWRTNYEAGMYWGRRFNRPWFWIVAPIVLLVLALQALTVVDPTPNAEEAYTSCFYDYNNTHDGWHIYADGDPRQKIESAKLDRACPRPTDEQWWDRGHKLKWRWQR